MIDREWWDQWRAEHDQLLHVVIYEDWDTTPGPTRLDFARKILREGLRPAPSVQRSVEPHLGMSVGDTRKVNHVFMGTFEYLDLLTDPVYGPLFGVDTALLDPALVLADSDVLSRLVLWGHWTGQLGPDENAHSFGERTGLLKHPAVIHNSLRHGTLAYGAAVPPEAVELIVLDMPLGVGDAAWDLDLRQQAEDARRESVMLAAYFWGTTPQQIEVVYTFFMRATEREGRPDMHVHLSTVHDVAREAGVIVNADRTLQVGSGDPRLWVWDR